MFMSTEDAAADGGRVPAPSQTETQAEQAEVWWTRLLSWMF